MKKSWQEKLNASVTYEVKPAPKQFADIAEGELMLLPSAQLIDEYVRAIPQGQSRNLTNLRNDLAKETGADKACPVVSGIFLRVVAEAAMEAHDEGTPLANISPVWRILDEKTTAFKRLSSPHADLILHMRQEEEL
ncbi:MAG: hypothetical protein ACR2OR_14890 [Hyphomicrobiales bacterium]